MDEEARQTDRRREKTVDRQSETYSRPKKE